MKQVLHKTFLRLRTLILYGHVKKKVHVSVEMDPDIISLFSCMLRNVIVLEELDESPDLLRIAYPDLKRPYVL